MSLLVNNESFVLPKMVVSVNRSVPTHCDESLWNETFKIGCRNNTQESQDLRIDLVYKEKNSQPGVIWKLLLKCLTVGGAFQKVNDKALTLEDNSQKTIEKENKEALLLEAEAAKIARYKAEVENIKLILEQIHKTPEE